MPSTAGRCVPAELAECHQSAGHKVTQVQHGHMLRKMATSGLSSRSHHPGPSDQQGNFGLCILPWEGAVCKLGEQRITLPAWLWPVLWGCIAKKPHREPRGQ